VSDVTTSTQIFSNASLHNNPAWVQLLGLCPLLAVSTSIVNALGLSLATALVIIGANSSIAMLRNWIPTFARLPCFVLIIATFTTTAMLLLQAYAFELYLSIALFIQIIVTNCMILSRAESFASRQSVGASVIDALGTAIGFAAALLLLGAFRELLGAGTLFAGMAQLFGPTAESWRLELLPERMHITLLSLPPGAFLAAGLLLAAGNALKNWTVRRRAAPNTTPNPADGDVTENQGQS
jgi:electron transport complex protein RnfE